MKKIIKIVAVFCLSALMVTCGKERTREEKVSAIINKVDSPFVVMSMTPQNLMDKSGVLDGVLPFTYELILSFFIDESVTGIDYTVKSQIVVGNGNLEPSFYGIFKIKDESKFKELIEKEANATITEKEGFKTAAKEGDGYAVVWNEEFAIISNIPMDIFAMLNGTGGNQGDKTINKLIDLMKAAEDGEINTTYAEFLNKPADLSIYYDGKGLYNYLKNMLGQNADELEPVKESIEGLSAEAFLNFNEGEISFELINHLSDKLKTDLAFIQDKGVSEQLFNYANGKEPFFVGSYNIKFKDFFEFVERQSGEDGLEDMEYELANVGLSIDQVKKALSGEFVYMIDGMKEVVTVYDEGTEYEFSVTEPMPVFGIAMGVSDVSVINILLADSLKLPNGTYQMDKAFLCLKDNVLFASTDSSWTNRIASNNGTSIKENKDLYASKPIAMFMDFSKLAGFGDEEITTFFKVFNQFKGSADMNGGLFTMSLHDKSKNSLRVLTELVANELDKMEKSMNQELEDELESAVQEGLDQLNGEGENVEVEEVVE